ncbi:hypothetical protein NDU88_003818 [Pleurodeles waltl]|uniref:Uncharacterized protein n=1 Tax=Pleurodeles waltl TaxID=8319 RepID=A0AAV7PAY9_PLEWA|nr:hypothetical protein NDU88_003818 [Pleurodeles waltl]
MDQYTAQNAGWSLQKDSSGPPEKGAEPTGAQILAAIEASGQAVQTQIAAISVDANLLRADLRVVAEHSVATEQQVTCMKSDIAAEPGWPSRPPDREEELQRRIQATETRRVCGPGLGRTGDPKREQRWAEVKRAGCQTNWARAIEGGPVCGTRMGVGRQTLLDRSGDTDDSVGVGHTEDPWTLGGASPCVEL